MQKKDIVLPVIAGVTGLLGFFLVLNVLKGSTAPAFPFVAASKAIVKGKVITADDLTMSKPLKSLDASTLYFQIQDVVGLTADQDIAPGHLIYRVQVKKEVIAPTTPIAESPKKISLPLPLDMRGFSLNQKEVEGYSDTITVGSFVDVLGVVPNFEGKLEMQTIVSAAQIIAINDVDDKGKRRDNPSFILAVPNDVSEFMTRAIGQGKIRLVLRGDDAQRAIYQGVGYTEIIRGIKKEKSFPTDKSQGSLRSDVPTSEPETPESMLDSVKEKYDELTDNADKQE